MRRCTVFLAILVLVLPVTTKAGPQKLAELEEALAKGPAVMKMGPVTTRLHSRMQIYFGWVGEDALLTRGDLMQEPGLRLRRARLGMDVEAYDWLKFQLELDLFARELSGGPLYQVALTFMPTHYIGLVAGVRKFPFAYSSYRSSAYFAHMERSLAARAMGPGNTLGVAVVSEPWKGHAKVEVGVYNGLSRLESFQQGFRNYAITEGNKFERLSYAGRIEVTPFGAVGPGEADLEHTETPKLSVGGAAYYNDGKTVRSLGATGHLHFKWNGMHFLGEAFYEWAKPQKEPTTIYTIPTTEERFAAQASVGYVARLGLGLAARVEFLNENMDIEDNQDEVAIAATFTWYAIGQNLKLQAEYQRRVELHGKSLSNDAVLGGVQFFF